ncbi:hypothetical protein ACFL04_01795 [Patescibacteria group bacterium]
MGKGNRTAIGGLMFGLGLIGLLIGVLTDVYTTTIGVVIMLAIWLVGGPLVALMSRGKGQTPPQNTEEPPSPPSPPPPQQQQ